MQPLPAPLVRRRKPWISHHFVLSGARADLNRYPWSSSALPSHGSSVRRWPDIVCLHADIAVLLRNDGDRVRCPIHSVAVGRGGIRCHLTAGWKPGGIHAGGLVPGVRGVEVFRLSLQKGPPVGCRLVENQLVLPGR